MERTPTLRMTKISGLKMKSLKRVKKKDTVKVYLQVSSWDLIFNILLEKHHRKLINYFEAWNLVNKPFLELQQISIKRLFASFLVETNCLS